MRMNKRVYNDRSHEHIYTEEASHSDSDDHLDLSNCEDLANLARCQTNQPMHDEQEIAAARRGYKDAIQKGNDSLAIYWDTEYPTLCLLETSVFENGDLSLHAAVRVDNIKLMLYLLTEGLSPNCQNQKTGDTPMHVVCRNQKVSAAKVIAILLKHSADPQIWNNEGHTPLDVAYIQEHPDADVIELLSREVQDDAVMTLLETLSLGIESLSITIGEGGGGAVEGGTESIIGSHGTESMDGGSFLFPPNTGYTTHSPLTLSPMIPQFNSGMAMTPLSIVNDITDVLHPDPVEKQSVSLPLGVDDIADVLNAEGEVTEAEEAPNDDESNRDPGFMSLTMEEILKLDAQKMVRSHSKHNPFGLHRQRTADLMNRMLSIQRVEGRIPELRGWLKKRNKEGKWRKKWVVARGAFILWADKQIVIADVSDRRQRRKYNGHYNLYSISKVEPVTSGLKHERKWKFTIGHESEQYPNKVFVWKAKKEQDRDDWVHGLQRRKDLLNLYHGYLEDGRE